MYTHIYIYICQWKWLTAIYWCWFRGTMNSEVNRSIHSFHMKQIAAKKMLLFIVHTAKATQGKEMHHSVMSKSVT